MTARPIRSEYCAWQALATSRFPVKAVPIGKRSLWDRVRKVLGI
jgi:hypothetical protein